MDLDHEYSLLAGMNRAKIGHWIGGVAASISAVIALALPALIDLAKWLGVPSNLPPSIVSLFSAATIWVVLYFLFDRWLWRWRPVNRLVKTPDLTGVWRVEGVTLDQDERPRLNWTGNITIIQSWDRIKIHLETPDSKSNSLSAAVFADPMGGYSLLYHYKNEPRAGKPELKAHRGFAELVFAADCRTAEGDYANGFGRGTFGTMQLTRT
jgi:hypothetical protein